MNTNKTEFIVNLINNLIEEAVCDGADSGGAYHQNSFNLSVATNDLISALGLENDYKIIEELNPNFWSNIKIVSKN